MSNSNSDMPQSQGREEALFALALEKPAAKRAAFLDAMCEDAPALRQRLDALLRAYDEPDGLSPKGAPAAVATMKLELAEPPDEAVGQTLGRYKLLERIGEGGCGVVYVAEQTQPVRRRVAFKVIKLGMDTKQVVARFEAERQALAMMDHPNIAKVLDAGTTETGRPFFVMELVRGIRITEYCDQNNLTTTERLDLFIKVCHAIQHAHQKGIIHRDIKPSNILVTLHDGVPVPKVIDFGIAKATEGRLTDNTVYTQLNQFIGTPAYMSPEQAEMSGLDIDTRSDIYSLGVLLYELLAGSTPFDANELISQGLDAMRKTIREKEPVRPSTRFATLQGEELTTTAKRRSTETSKLIRQLKGDLDWIVMKCLEKDRTRRYDTANGIAADLKRHLNNEPVVARPPNAAYKFQKAFRRNKLVFTAVGAVTAALVLGTIASTWQSIRATRAQKESEAAEAQALKAQANEAKQRQLAEQEVKRADKAKKIADHETMMARRAAAQADARYLLEQRLLPDALPKATEAFKLGGEWEDGLLINDIASAARQTWVLAARWPVNEPSSVSFVAKTGNGPCLVLSRASGLSAVDIRTGRTLGEAALEQGAQYLFQGPDTNSLVAVSESAISVLALPSLAVKSQKALTSPVTYASVSGNILALLLQGFDASLFDLRTLSQIDSFNWSNNPICKNLGFAHHLAASPDGHLVLLHGGAWTQPMIMWDRHANPPTFTAQQMYPQEFQFIDNRRFVTWYMASSDSVSRTAVYDVASTEMRATWLTLPNDDTKGHLQLQCFSSRDWSDFSAYPILGFIGPSGLVLKGIAGDELKRGSGDFFKSDRYANLLPTESAPPQFLAADLAQGVLALLCRNDVLVFRNASSFWGGDIKDYCVTASRDGLLCVNHNFTPDSVRLYLIPFDPKEEAARFSLQWPADSKWAPWAIAATPDNSTVAVIAQETDSDTTVTARYGRIRALLYHPVDFRHAPAAWPIVRAFEIDSPVADNWSPRFVAMDPDARALLFWNSDTTVTRYDTRDGKPLGSLELGLVSARSRDGSRVAAVSPAGRLRVHEVASGKTLLDVAGRPASSVCFSTDGTTVVADQDDMINAYDVASSRLLSAIHSSLMPIAYPSRGNRFLAYQPDATGKGGSLVLASTADASVAAVLNRAASPFTPAFFSDSGDQLALARGRWTAEVVRSLRPEQLASVLAAALPESDPLQALAPVNLVTTSPRSRSAADAGSAVIRSDDMPALLSRIGDQVTVQGHVQTTKLVNTRNAANIYFDGPRTNSVMLWVPWDTYPKVVALLGPDLGAVLNNHTVRATGRLTRYRDTLEVTVEDPTKLVVVAPVDESK